MFVIGRVISGWKDNLAINASFQPLPVSVLDQKFAAQSNHPAT
jgi:hypothetical protein